MTPKYINSFTQDPTDRSLLFETVAGIMGRAWGGCLIGKALCDPGLNPGLSTIE